MINSYYNIPFEFDKFFEKKDLKKISLQESISQFIGTIVTTQFEEYKFDDNFGSEIWETDFDLLTNTNVLKEKIKNSLSEKIKTYEKRLSNIEVILNIGEDYSETGKKVRLKKYLTITVQGIIKKTDEPYSYRGYYYIAPLSHK